METYGQRVAKLRDELDRTQEQLAAQIGVPTRTLQDIETGKVAKPQRKTREKIDAALGALAPGEATQDLPGDVSEFLDLLAVYLMALRDDESRTGFMHVVMRAMASWNR